ncbi:MAG: PKD domain-containing protein, partial [Opitutales bacterium]
GAGPGATVNLSASATDPDGDEVAFEWVFYPEASTGVGELDINNDTEANASFVVPEDASPNDEIHVYLAATDNGAPALTRYCRLVVLVGDSDPSGPSADAGEDQAARDDDGDGFESVTLDGSASSDDGAIVSYTWTWDDGTAREATGVAPTLTLPVGSHIITLTVIDDEENFDSDTVTVNVLPEPGTVAFFEDFSSGDLSNWVEPPGHEVGTLGLRFETVGYNRPCALNRDEQITHLTLWMTPRSPLFLGCDLREMDESTLAHVANPLALTVNQSFENPAPVLQEGPLCIWKSTAPDGRRAACAIFNRGESPLTHQLDASRQARDVWTGEALSAAELAALDVPPHGARFIVADQ